MKGIESFNNAVSGSTDQQNLTKAAAKLLPNMKPLIENASNPVTTAWVGYVDKPESLSVNEFEHILIEFNKYLDNNTEEIKGDSDLLSKFFEIGATAVDLALTQESGDIRKYAKEVAQKLDSLPSLS